MSTKENEEEGHLSQKKEESDVEKECMRKEESANEEKDKKELEKELEKEKEEKETGGKSERRKKKNKDNNNGESPKQKTEKKKTKKKEKKESHQKESHQKDTKETTKKKEQPKLVVGSKKWKEKERKRWGMYFQKLNNPEEDLTDEVRLLSVGLDGILTSNLQHMENYKCALDQIVRTLIYMMRHGNKTTSMTNIVSEKRHAIPELLYRSVYQTAAFWSASTEYQPALNESIKKNCDQLAAVERCLQERGPPLLEQVRNFQTVEYPRYAQMKKDLKKHYDDKKAKTDKKDFIDYFEKFFVEQYKNAKPAHLGEIRCAIAQIQLFHQGTEKYWLNISKKKDPGAETYLPPLLDYRSFFH